MNTTRLYLIAREILNDINSRKLLKSYDGFIGALNNLMNAQNEQHQSQLVASKDALIKHLRESSFNNLPRTWASSLDELDLSEYFGTFVAENIENLMRDNEKTLVVVREYAQSVRDKVQSFHDSFNSIVGSFDTLGVAPESIERDEAELSFLIPSNELDGNVKKLSKELKIFSDFVDDASELTVGSRGQMKLREISSSDPSLVIVGAAATVLAVLKVVREIQKVIEGTYKIREAKATAEAAEIKKETIELMAAQATEQIKAGLVNVVDFMINDAKLEDKTRKENLRRRVEIGIDQLANRLDHGYQIDGDATFNEAAAGQDGEDAQEKSAKTKLVAEEIQKTAKEIRHVRLPDTPVLQLESRDSDEEEGD